jgi:hypothetical protein
MGTATASRSPNAERHLTDAHPDLIGKPSRDDVLANATEA